MNNLLFKDKVFQSYLKVPNHELILPSLIIAQGILESVSGTSELAVKANNLFGVKGSGDLGSFNKETKEWSKSKGWFTINASFKKYSSIDKALEDQINRFTTMDRYKKLIGEKDYKKVARLVWEGGYATSPIYVQQLIQIIELHKLYEYDELVRKLELPTWAVEPTKTAIGNLVDRSLLSKELHLDQSQWATPLPKYLFWLMLDKITEYVERRRK